MLAEEKKSKAWQDNIRRRVMSACVCPECGFPKDCSDVKECPACGCEDKDADMATGFNMCSHR